MAVTTTGEALPTLSSAVPDLPLWQKPLALSDPTLVKQIATAMAAGQSVTSGRHQWRWSKAVNVEILRLKARATSRPEQEACEILLFNLAITPLRLSANTGQFHLTFNWIIRSISDHPVTQGSESYPFHTNPARVVRLVRSKHPALFEWMPPAGVTWLDVFFYYERRRNASPALAERMLRGLTTWTIEQVRRYRSEVASSPESSTQALVQALEEATSAAMMMADWALVYSSSAPEIHRLVREVETVHEDQKLPERVRARSGVFLTGPAASHTHTSVTARADDVLHQFGHALLGHETLQLKIAAWSDSITDHADELIDAVKSYRAGTMGRWGDATIPRAYSEARLSSLLRLPLYQIFEEGEVGSALDVLCAWYDIEGSPRSSTVLAFAPTLEDAFVAATQEDVLWIPRDTDTHLETVTGAADAFLGTATTLSFSTSYQPSPRNSKTPNPEAGAAFERAIRSYYELEDINARECFRESDALLPYPGNGHPLQAVMLKALGWTRPVTASLQEPAPDRQLRRVLLWPAGTSSLDIEVEVVEEALGGIIEKVPREQLSRKRFFEAYQDPAYDAIWLISHGGYSRYAPDRASIVVREEQLPKDSLHITLAELARLPVPGDRRRLLFLNVCDGAVAADLGGLNRIGFAPQLARRNQAVIAHLWSVHVMSAALFAALLADGLRDDSSFFEAYAQAISVMAAGPDRAADHVQSFAPSALLLDSLEEVKADMTNLAWWGPAAFLE